MAAQQQTPSAPRRKFSLAARGLFLTLDLLHGKQRTMAKFKALETVARVPYPTWEHVVPQMIACGYYRFSWLRYVVNPKSSYGLNADFEDHAEHEYMQWVADNPGWETEPFDSGFAHEYGVFDAMADLFRQIDGHDERVHKDEGLAAMDSPRFE